MAKFYFYISLAFCFFLGARSDAFAEEVVFFHGAKIEQLNINPELNRVSKRNIRESLLNRPICVAPRNFKRRVIKHQNSELAEDIHSEWEQIRRQRHKELHRSRQEAFINEQKSFFQILRFSNFPRVESANIPDQRKDEINNHIPPIQQNFTKDFPPQIPPLSPEEINQLNSELNTLINNRN